MREPKAAEPPGSDSQAPASPRDPALGSSGTHRAQPPNQANPLGPRELEQLARAGERTRALRRAQWLAYMNGGTLLFCALACVPFALFDATLLLPASALGACGAVELRGAVMLRKFDLRAPRWLAANQLVLLALVALYCAAGIVRALRGASVADELASVSPAAMQQLHDGMPELDLSGEAFDRGYRALVAAFYAVLFVASAIYQLLCARFYAARAALLRAFVMETPEWVRQVQRRLGG